MFQLRHVSGTRAPVTLDEGRRYVLGRAPEADLPFPEDGTMSRAHAELSWNGSAWVLTNRSQHGSWVGEEKIDGERTLAPGSVLVLGETKLVLESAAPATPVAPLTPGGAPGAVAPEGAGYDDQGQFHMGFTMLGAAPPGAAGAKPAKTAQQSWKDRNLRFFVVTLVCALLGTCCMSCYVIFPALQRFPGEFLIASFLAFLPALPYLMLYKLLDRNGQIPYKNFFACFFWGATVGCGVSVVLNTEFGAVLARITNPETGDLATRVVIAPIFEESMKGLAVLVVFLILRDEFDNALEGMLLGAASGLGFAVVENCTYFTNFLIQGGPGALLVMGTFRILTIAFIGHPVYTSMTGLGLGLARELGKSPLRFVTPIIGWMFAVFFHALWNGSGAAIGTIFGDEHPFLGLFALAIFIGGGTLFFFFCVLVFALVKERRVLVLYLKDEVDRGFIEADELAGFSSLFGREKFVLGGLGKGTYKLRKELRRAQLELAFRKWHLEQGDAVKGTVVDADLLDARTRIRDARNALNAREGRDRRGKTA